MMPVRQLILRCGVADESATPSPARLQRTGSPRTSVGSARRRSRGGNAPQPGHSHLLTDCPVLIIRGRSGWSREGSTLSDQLPPITARNPWPRQSWVSVVNSSYRFADRSPGQGLTSRLDRLPSLLAAAESKAEEYPCRSCTSARTPEGWARESGFTTKSDRSQNERQSASA